MDIRLEIVVDDPEGLAAAAGAGVDRIELCGGLALGALTPSAGFMRLAADCGVPVHAMIRPRPGDFLFSPDELRCALDDIAASRAAGLAGVVIGATRPDGRLDAAALARQMDAAGPIEVTLHRAFDVTPDADEALETAVALGIGRIMTAGHAPRAIEGIAELARLTRLAAGRITIMAGGAVAPEDVAPLIAAGVRDLHAACGVMGPNRGPLGGLRLAPERGFTDAAAIRALQGAIAAAGGQAGPRGSGPVAVMPPARKRPG